jgi:hypothetical protein
VSGVVTIYDRFTSDEYAGRCPLWLPFLASLSLRPRVICAGSAYDYQYSYQSTNLIDTLREAAENVTSNASTTISIAKTIESSVGDPANVSTWHELYTDATAVIDAAAPFLLPSRALLLRSHLMLQIATHYHGQVTQVP